MSDSDQLAVAIAACTQLAPSLSAGRCGKLAFPKSKAVDRRVPLLSNGSDDRRNEASIAVGGAVKWDKGHLCIVAQSTDGTVAARTLKERLEFLEGNQHRSFKEEPDKFGNDLLWWSVEDDVINVYRAQVKLGLSGLSVPTTAAALVSGWESTLCHFFCVGDSHRLVHKPLILTTRKISDCYESQNKKCQTRKTDGTEVMIVDRNAMRPLWSEAVQKFGANCGLTQYCVIASNAGGGADETKDGDDGGDGS